ncbi:hypothetical protein HpBTM60_04580 [Helicobacter pylori]
MILSDTIKVKYKLNTCGHYRKFNEFKRRTFNKSEFEQFCRDRGLNIEE